MPSLISPTERANLTGVFNDIFDTFKTTIIVYKESIKVPVTPVNPDNYVYGFGDVQSESAYTYEEKTGIFPAVVRYPNSMDANRFKTNQAEIKIPEGGISIKVKKDCRDFINHGKTEKITVDDKIYYLDSDDRKQAFLDSEFWVFVLKGTR